MSRGWTSTCLSRKRHVRVKRCNKIYLAIGYIFLLDTGRYVRAVFKDYEVLGSIPILT